MTNVLDTPVIKFEVIDGVLHATYKKGVKLSLEIARQVVADRLKFTGDAVYPIIIHNQGVISIDKPARDFLASEEGTRNLTAGALLLDSAFGSFLGNFLLSVTKPRMPAKIFTKPDAAIKWLQQYKK